ncbi:hypothetical protein SLW73_03995 [Glutamicibacter protophormiae]|uniref:hypothetical protein n=1 Tax=Glutamicibacter protophormiae TaxID=37930 RepID=UPI002A7FE309|nr:hypothetical protein [Glutamicibacter protophormiae]WPR65494.1 hypothetical protein SLW72_03995 [Glutamicibacter protophormiae]WPR68992.1 hypothetical protein SLW73_03995 [Glutamicibacter protophormiae]
MAHRQGFRPQAKLQKRPWLDKDGTRTPGIALMHGAKVIAHMTAAEARAIADKLHDYADQTEQDEAP